MTDGKQQEQGGWSSQQQAERVIVLQTLRDDRPEQWTRVDLEIEVDRIDALTVSDALALLEADGVVIVDGERVCVSACARRLDSLGLVSI
jgi:hypothetical protein